MAKYVGYYKDFNTSKNIKDYDLNYNPPDTYKDLIPTKKEFGIENINTDKIKADGDKYSNLQINIMTIFFLWLGIGIWIVIFLSLKYRWYPVLFWGLISYVLYRLSTQKYKYQDIYDKVKKYERAMFEYKWWQERKKRDFWLSMSGRQFEVEVANIFKNMGYRTTICKQGGDEGIDIEISKNGVDGIIQCKAHKSKISPSVARDLYGTMTANHVKLAYLITLHGATTGTIDFCKQHNIIIWDIDDILEQQDKINTEK